MSNNMRKTLTWTLLMIILPKLNYISRTKRELVKGLKIELEI
jgi:hypothetical protein